MGGGGLLKYFLPVWRVWWLYARNILADHQRLGNRNFNLTLATDCLRGQIGLFSQRSPSIYFQEGVQGHTPQEVLKFRSEFAGNAYIPTCF